MNNISTKLQRSNNKWIINISILTTFDECDKITLQFRTSHHENIKILGSSHGHILDNVIISEKVKSFDVDVSHVDSETSIECIISYFKDDNIVHCDASMVRIPKTSSIQTATAKPRKKGAGDTKWKTELHIAEDLILSVLTSDKSSMLVAFGEDSESLEHTDVIFNLYPTMNKIVIPKEIIWSKYSEYRSRKLGCYEITKPCIDNVYHKTLISNIVDVSDMKKGACDLSYFQCPSGKYFDSNKWRIGNSGLPEAIE